MLHLQHFPPYMPFPYPSHDQMRVSCACSRKGHLQFFMKEYDKALETYEAGLTHDPDNSELKEGIARCFEAINKVHHPCPIRAEVSTCVSFSNEGGGVCDYAQNTLKACC